MSKSLKNFITIGVSAFQQGSLYVEKEDRRKFWKNTLRASCASRF